MQEESIGAGYAVGALRGNAVWIGIFIGDLGTYHTFANVDSVAIIAAIAFVLGRGVGFAERIFAKAGELGYKIVALVASCANSVSVQTFAVGIPALSSTI